MFQDIVQDTLLGDFNVRVNKHRLHKQKHTSLKSTGQYLGASAVRRGGGRVLFSSLLDPKGRRITIKYKGVGKIGFDEWTNVFRETLKIS